MRNSNTNNTVVRVATQGFFKGASLSNTVCVLVDIDVSTPNEFLATEPDKVKQWIIQAHDVEKSEFFSLMPDEALAKLVEEWT